MKVKGGKKNISQETNLFHTFCIVHKNIPYINKHAHIAITL